MIDREETSVRTFFATPKEFIKGVCLEFIKNLDAWLEFDCITQDDLIQVHLHQQRKAKYLLKFSKIEKLIGETARLEKLNDKRKNWHLKRA